MDEKHVESYFSKLDSIHIKNVKLIRDKDKNMPVGYGFVEFRDKREACEVFQTLNGKPIPDQYNRVYKLNWASHGGGVARAGVS